MKVFNVRDFGAKGDWNGTTGTDDTTAFQKAVNAASRLSPQQQRILTYLEHGNVITNLQSWQVLGIYALSQRIGELISKGYVINKAWKSVHNMHGEKCRVRAYWIAK